MRYRKAVRTAVRLYFNSPTAKADNALEQHIKKLTKRYKSYCTASSPLDTRNGITHFIKNTVILELKLELNKQVGIRPEPHSGTLTATTSMSGRLDYKNKKVAFVTEWPASPGERYSYTRAGSKYNVTVPSPGSIPRIRGTAESKGNLLLSWGNCTEEVIFQAFTDKKTNLPVIISTEQARTRVTEGIPYWLIKDNLFAWIYKGKYYEGPVVQGKDIDDEEDEVQGLDISSYFRPEESLASQQWARLKFKPVLSKTVVKKMLVYGNFRIFLLQQTYQANGEHLEDAVYDNLGVQGYSFMTSLDFREVLILDTVTGDSNLISENRTSCLALQLPQEVVCGILDIQISVLTSKLLILKSGTPTTASKEVQYGLLHDLYPEEHLSYSEKMKEDYPDATTSIPFITDTSSVRQIPFKLISATLNTGKLTLDQEEELWSISGAVTSAIGVEGVGGCTAAHFCQSDAGQLYFNIFSITYLNMLDRLYAGESGQQFRFYIEQRSYDSDNFFFQDEETDPDNRVNSNKIIHVATWKLQDIAGNVLTEFTTELTAAYSSTYYIQRPEFNYLYWSDTLQSSSLTKNLSKYCDGHKWRLDHKDDIEKLPFLLATGQGRSTSLQGFMGTGCPEKAAVEAIDQYILGRPSALTMSLGRSRHMSMYVSPNHIEKKDYLYLTPMATEPGYKHWQQDCELVCYGLGTGVFFFTAWNNATASIDMINLNNAAGTTYGLLSTIGAVFPDWKKAVIGGLLGVVSPDTLARSGIELEAEETLYGLSAMSMSAKKVFPGVLGFSISFCYSALPVIFTYLDQYNEENETHWRSYYPYVTRDKFYNYALSLYGFLIDRGDSSWAWRVLPGAQQAKMALTKAHFYEIDKQEQNKVVALLNNELVEE